MDDIQVHRALALVETSLRSIEDRNAVRRETGGTAPELVQGILDSVGEQWDRIEKSERELVEARQLVEEAESMRDLARSRERNDTKNRKVELFKLNRAVKEFRAGCVRLTKRTEIAERELAEARASRDTALQQNTALTVELSEIAEEAIVLFRALKKYGDHLMPCDCENGTVDGSGKPCSCGLAQALAGGEER